LTPVSICRCFSDCQARHFSHHAAELPGNIKNVDSNHHAKRKYRW
jgi:hypothetical protein